MPTTQHILDGLTKIANDWQALDPMLLAGAVTLAAASAPSTTRRTVPQTTVNPGRLGVTH
jgi:hypothetical protein